MSTEENTTATATSDGSALGSVVDATDPFASSSRLSQMGSHRPGIQKKRRPPTRGNWQAIESVEPQERPRLMLEEAPSTPSADGAPRAPRATMGKGMPVFDPKAIKLKHVEPKATPPPKPAETTTTTVEPKGKQKENDENTPVNQNVDNNKAQAAAPKRKFCIIS